MQFIEKNKYIIAGLVCVLIISFALIYNQYSKQSSIERQKQMDIAQENKILDEKKTEEASNKLSISWCLISADDAYWSYVELNGTGKRDGPKGVTAQMSVWNTAKADKKAAEDACYRKYQ